MLRSTFVCLGFLVWGMATRGYGDSWILPFLRRNLEKPDLVVEATEWQMRQRFLLNLLLQVHKPLLHEELIEMGSQLNEDPREYEEGSWPKVKEFLESVHGNKIPRPFAIFSQLDEEMPQLLLGVYRFLSLAKDWSSFQRNACFARIHFHPVLFVNALQMAVSDRKDTQDLRLPAMFEVLPQLYFEREVILAAQEIAWHQLTPVRLVTPKRRWKDILLGPARISLPPNEEALSRDPLVIDNSRQVAHVSLDLELNSYWNSLINRLVLSTEEEKQRASDNIIIDGDRLVAFRGPQDEEDFRRTLVMETNPHFFYSLRQFMSALSLEDLVTGQKSMEIIDPPLVTTGGVPYKPTDLDIEAIERILDLTMQDLKNQIESAIKWNDNESENVIIANSIISNNYLHTCRQLGLAINGYRINEPSMLSLATANLRDPIYRSLLNRLNQLLVSHEENNMPSEKVYDSYPEITEVEVGYLSTFEETFDTDLINLIDQQLLQSRRNNLQFLRRRLVARQRRLNHDPFDIKLDIISPSAMTLHLVIYLTLPDESRESAFQLHSSLCSLKKGFNKIHLHFPMALKELSLSELYEAEYPKTQKNKERFPPHLQLPRGTTEGLPLQMIVELAGRTSMDDGKL
ncbi:fat-body protein 1 [Drosophila ananassae]|nr:fat-body protein 1 [Drosophila ananassae]